MRILKLLTFSVSIGCLFTYGVCYWGHSYLFHYTDLDDISIHPSVSVAFTPGSGEESVIDVINGARKTLNMAAYSFTSRAISDALIAAHNRGVEVLVVIDNKEGKARYSKAPWLVQHDIEVRYDNNYEIMHNKFIVSDGELVETGSYNYSSSAATRNAENVVVIKDVSVANTFRTEFFRLWLESKANLN